MQRKEFMQILGGAIGAITLSSFQSLSESFKEEDFFMPAYFVGHGSPMNAIEDNEFSRHWAELGQEMPKPKAIICVSAHWFTRGTFVTAMEQPKTIHDFGGFPQALFDVQYPAPGSPKLAQEAAKMIQNTNVGLDKDWGLDHGTWSVLRKIYPNADVPVIQLSIDYTKPAKYHYDLSRQLLALRKKGVLIVGSGNMVHNLGMLSWQNSNGYDWAIEANNTFKQLIEKGDHGALIQYEKLGNAAKLSIPSPDHYLPLLYALALKEKNEKVSFFNDKTVMGAISMTSVKIG